MCWNGRQVRVRYEWVNAHTSSSLVICIENTVSFFLIKIYKIWIKIIILQIKSYFDYEKKLVYKKNNNKSGIYCLYNLINDKKNYS
jgi:hypothetical protein